ncbi:hypothetical protein [Ideonella sp.]|uniref:COG4648 family protein n=1 Tax=Ideonella sp. TaxID=1929293 RepID=UPI0035B1FBF7
MTRRPSDAPHRIAPARSAPAPRLRAAATAAVLVLTLAYPFVVAFGADRLPPGGVAAALVAVAVLRAALARDPVWWLAAAGAVALAAVSSLGHGWLPLKLYPVLVNASLLAVFGLSLHHGPPLVERLARVAEPALPAEAVAYTRRVTQAWCVFFLANGLVAAATAVWSSTRVWAAYNGFVAYLLIGAMFGGEWLLRRRLKARLAAAPDAAVPRSAA